MPTYEYLCLDCGHRVEYFQSMAEPPRTECPVCHGHLSRLVSGGAGLIFKGSGFYITDYKGNSKGSPKSEPATKSESSSPEVKSTDSLPTAAKSDAGKE